MPRLRRQMRLRREPLDMERVERSEAAIAARLTGPDLDRAFALAYTEAKFDLVAAAMAMGCSREGAIPYARKMMRRPGVRAHLQRHFSQSAATAEEVLAFLGQALRGDVAGEIVGLKERIDVAKSLLRVHGLWSRKPEEVQEPKDVAKTIDVTRLTDEELRSLSAIARRMAEDEGQVIEGKVLEAEVSLTEEDPGQDPEEGFPDRD